MSSDIAANILFGDLRCSYDEQQTRVDQLRLAADKLEAQFLTSVRYCAARTRKSLSDQEKKCHDELRLALNRTRLQLADEVKLLQWLRRRHNSRVFSRKAGSRYLVF